MLTMTPQHKWSGILQLKHGPQPYVFEKYSRDNLSPIQGISARCSEGTGLHLALFPEHCNNCQPSMHKQDAKIKGNAGPLVFLYKP